MAGWLIPADDDEFEVPERTADLRTEGDGRVVTEVDGATGRPGTSSAEPLLRLFLIAVAATLLPIAVSAIRAVQGRRVPVGDNAFFAIRSRDVLSWDPPLLGTWTSASLNSQTQFNNPGPLLFDLLALPTRLVPGGSGLAVGVALLNMASVVGIAVFAYRRGGSWLGTMTMAFSAVLCWTLGSEVLIDAPQPASLLLPFLLFVVLVWSVCCGDQAALPWAAGLGSLLLQSYITYVYLVAALAGFALVSVGLQVRAARRDSASWTGARRGWARAAGITVGVLAICWLQPLIEQLTQDPGNLTRLSRAARDPALDPMGFELGIRVVAQVLTVPPWWLRPSFRDYLGETTSFRPAPIPSTGVAAAMILTVTGLLVALWMERRRHDRTSAQAVATALVLLAGGLVTAGRMPVGAFGTPNPHAFRWLWPVGAFIALSVTSGLVGRWQARRPAAIIAASFALVAVVMGGLNLPASNQDPFEAASAAGCGVDGCRSDSSFPGVRDLGGQMAVLKGEGTLLVDVGDNYFSPYGTAVLAQLQRQGIPFVVEDPQMLYQLGPERRYDGRNADARLQVTYGDETRTRTPGARRVALHEALGLEEQAELRELRERIRARIRATGLPLDPTASAAIDDLRAASGSDLGPGTDPPELFASRQLVRHIESGVLDLDPVWAPRFERYAQLQRRWDDHTVAIFLAPIDAAGR